MRRILVITLGCDKNTVDSENVLGFLKKNSFIPVTQPEDADIIIINTCGFIEAAKKESINAILEAVQYKKTNENLKILVAGCMVNRYENELAKEIPEIDIFLKHNDLQNLAEKLDIIDASNAKDEEIIRVLTNQYSSYLKIAEGCNKHCTYCAIPMMRGEYKSREIEALIREANYMLKNGVKEISLIAQDVTSYGIDLYNNYRLPELLTSINKNFTDFWLRLLYCYPDQIGDELIETIANSNKICKYIDIPLQHAHPDILRKMGRKSTPEEIMILLEKLRKKIPDIAIRTTFIVGFPGETQEHFEYLIDFVKKAKFDWLGSFTYSREEGTPAALLSKQISETIKIERYNELMATQKIITQENNQKLVGQELKVLVEGKSDEFNEIYYFGRSQYQGPEIDGITYIRGENLKIGDFCQVKITRVEDYDLIGEIIK